MDIKLISNRLTGNPEYPRQLKLERAGVRFIVYVNFDGALFFETGHPVDKAMTKTINALIKATAVDTALEERADQFRRMGARLGK
jgi:hypothetical protein